LQHKLKDTIDDPRELIFETQRSMETALSNLRSGVVARFKSVATRTVLVSVAIGADLGASVLEKPLVTSGAIAFSGLAINIASSSSRKRDTSFSYLHQLERKFPATRLS
jgi:hypothetical protein